MGVRIGRLISMCIIKLSPNKNKNKNKNNKNKQNKNKNKSNRNSLVNRNRNVEMVFGQNPGVRVINKRMGSRTSTPKLSQCALKFALALVNPWDPGAMGVCNPAGKETFTMPAHSVQRFSVTTGTGGTAFVQVSPCLANDYPNVWYSGPNFALSATQILTGNNAYTTGVLPGEATTLPFNSSQLANQSVLDSPLVTGRIVSVGVRLTYSGTTLNEGGFMYALHDPNHMNTSGAAASDIGSYVEAQVAPVSRKPLTLTIYPITDVEDQMAFQAPYAGNSNTSTNTLYPLGQVDVAFNTTYKGTTAYAINDGPLGSTVAVAAPIACIVINSTAGNTFECEIITHVEYSGQLSQYMSRRAHTDFQGAITVKNAYKESSIITAQRSNTQYDPWGDFRSVLSEVAGDIAKSAIPAGIAAVRSLLH